jgi:hypothetical protein
MMSQRTLHALTLCVFPSLLAASGPITHLQTSDHFAGYAGTRTVPASVAALWLTWAETDIPGSQLLRRYGVKTMLYTDPNRAMRGDADFTSDESAFAHDCMGQRIMAHMRGQYLMDPHSQALLATWKSHVTRYTAEGHFDAVFEDDADTVAYANAQPCNFEPQDWLHATIAMQRALGYPIIYNGLSNFSDRSVSISIGLNETAIGGLMEECYSTASPPFKTSGDRWLVAEATELQMVAERKLFFCYDNDTTDAAHAIDRRLYVLGSFLLSYDPGLSVLWEYYQGPSHFHVMPEVQLVPLRPQLEPRSIDDLRTPSGVYVRAYGDCYLAGRSQGPCTVAVNPDSSPHPLYLRGLHRTLQLSGGGILDGGAVRISATAPPSSLAAFSAIVAF